MSIFIPAYGENEGIFFAPQIFACKTKSESCFITGQIDQEIEQSVYISLSLLRKMKLRIPNYLHIHFPDYCYMKSGISASLGVFITLYYKLQHKSLKNDYMMSGEIDLQGNISVIGQVSEKFSVFEKSGCDYFFIPYLQDFNVSNERVIKLKNVRDVIQVINGLEKNAI